MTPPLEWKALSATPVPTPGVVIIDEPMVDYVPLHRPTNGSKTSPIKTATQYEMSIVDKLAS